MMYLDEAKGQPVTYSGSLDAAALDQWVKDLLMKSEAVPDTPQYHDGSLVVVGKTFEEVVSNKNQELRVK